jgi:hypothetical protein
MGDEGPSREVREIVLVQTEQASFEGSGYDAGLTLDTTPTSRVDWAAGQQPERRSAYDAKMVVDTTPTTLCVPRIPSMALTSGVALPLIRP